MVLSQRLPSSGLCVTSSTVVPCSLLMRRSSANTALALWVSKLPVGSSASSEVHRHGHVLLEVLRGLQHTQLDFYHARLSTDAEVDVAH